MLLVSDYDGTIKKYYKNPTIFQKLDLKKDIKAINKFVNNGNIFTLSTYRKTPSIKREIEKYKILYNYLTIYNGLVTIDRNDRVINAKYIDNNVVKEIIRIANRKGFIDKVTFYNEYGITDSIENIIMIGIKCSMPSIIINALKDMNVFYEYNRETIWIHERSDKIDAVKMLKDYLKIEENEIYTIGDSEHDSEMIRNYNGHCIMNSDLDQILYIRIPREKNIRSLIKKLK